MLKNDALFELHKLDASHSFKKFTSSIVRSRWKQLSILLILGVLAATASLVQPLVIQSLIRKTEMATSIKSDVMLLFLFIVITAVIQWAQARISERLGETVLFEVRKSIAYHVACLSMKEYKRIAVGDIISCYSSDTIALKTFITGGYLKLISSFFLAIGAVIGMLYVDSSLFFITLLAVTLLAVLLMLPGLRFRTLTKTVQELLGESTRILESIIRNVRLIRSHNATPDELHRLDIAASKLKNAGYRTADVLALIAPINAVGLQILFLAILGLGGMRVARGESDLASITSFLMFLSLLIGPIGQVVSAYTEVMKAMAAYSRVTTVLERPLESSLSQMTNIPTSVSTPAAVHLSDITLWYDDVLALEELTLTAYPRQLTAVVGRSGSGKTSVFDAIVRFYDIEGDITIGERSIKTMSREEVRNSIVYVEQDAPVISGSLRHNLSLGGQPRTSAECMEVLNRLGLAHICDRLDGDLDAGNQIGLLPLSGGERQRVAIARALLSDKPIVLLDEPTANLDPITEWEMNQAIRTLASCKTVIMIAHRLSTVMDADQIYVLEKGRVLASGNHDNLLVECAEYREMVEKQMFKVN